ncbi:MAG TPA: SDR family oxidoreductase [Lysobacter sp.]
MERPLRVLVVGATGLIGAAIVQALLRRGHDVTPGVRDTAQALRRWPGRRAVAVDMALDVGVADWVARLMGIEAVVNAAGIFREHAGDTFHAVHEAAPKALFEACTRARVRRVVQVSALGADPRAESAFHLSKRAADHALLDLPLDACVVRPSLVFSPRGASTRLFLAWASGPWMLLPGDGGQRIQPVHLDDVADAVVRLLESPTVPATLDAVGPAPITLRAYLATLRRQLGLAPARSFDVPPAWLQAAASLLQRGRRGGFATDALRMLERGNTGDAKAMEAVLGRPPRDPSDFIDPRDAPRLLDEARLRWLLPMLRLSIALVWLGSGLVSLGLFPVVDSLALLSRVGLEATMARGALYTAAGLDLLLGLSMLWPPPRWLLKLQAAVIVGYTAILTVALPEFWLHPFAPLLKNLPILAGLWILHELQERKE